MIRGLLILAGASSNDASILDPLLAHIDETGQIVLHANANDTGPSNFGAEFAAFDSSLLYIDLQDGFDFLSTFGGPDVEPDRYI